jgi:uncharacterized membrane protein YccF (DUF307 family)
MKLSGRIWTAATTPMVRNVGPALGNAFKTFIQFIVFLAIGCITLLIAHISGNHGIPEHVTKSAVMVLGLIPMGFGILVAAEQVRLTYAKPKEIVYPSVEAFPDREPT